MISRQRRAADTLQRHDKPTISSEVHSAPILNIPTEILIEIFKEVRSIHEKDSQSQESPLPAAVFLSHVTRHWREISLGTPSMWTTIAVYRGHSPNLLRTCLERSKGCSLDVSITLLGYDDDHLFELVVSEISRCRRLVIETHEEISLNNIVLYLRDLSAPFLQHLQIYHDVDEQLGGLWGRTNILTGGAPVLTSFSLFGLCVDYCLPPPGAVTTLALGGAASMGELDQTMIYQTYGEFRKNLAMFSSLTSLILSKMVFEASPVDTPTSLEMPFLLSLTVSIPCNDDAAYTRDLFATISAPALQILTVSCTYEMHMPVFATHFQNRRYYPDLRSINFLEVEGMQYITEDFMRVSPNLTHLTFGATSYDHILALLSNHTSDLLWPNLQYLSVTYFDNDLLRNIVSSDRPLRTLQVRSASHLPAEDIMWMRERLRVEN